MSNEINQKGAVQLRNKVRGIVNDSNRAALDKCWALFEADRTLVRSKEGLINVWSVWGYKTWEECVGKEFNMYPTTAFYLVRIWETLVLDLGVPLDKIQDLGITKLRLITSPNVDLTKRNVNSWLKKARMKTCRELRAAIYGVKELRNLSFDVTGDQFALVQKGFEAAKEVYGDEESRGDLLVRIVSEWVAAKKPAQKAG